MKLGHKPEEILEAAKTMPAIIANQIHFTAEDPDPAWGGWMDAMTGDGEWGWDQWSGWLAEQLAQLQVSAQQQQPQQERWAGWSDDS